MRRDAYGRNVATIRRLATEILHQCDHYDRNTLRGYDDSMRVGSMFEAIQLFNIVQQARRRWDRERAARERKEAAAEAARHEADHD